MRILTIRLALAAHFETRLLVALEFPYHHHGLVLRDCHLSSVGYISTQLDLFIWWLYLV